MEKLYSDGTSFRDSSGNHVILSGINMVCKDKKAGYIGNYTEEDFKNLKKWGFNVVRLGIIWDGVEPEPGKYDARYLDLLEKFIKLAEKYEIYVFIDMHQDLYSYKYADGAPEWATITDGIPHVPTPELWSNAYLLSGAVQRAFDNFWNNVKASDGMGLQDHYAAAWRYIAKRYGNCPNVIGYDIMNEPFMGTSAEQVFGSILYTYAKEVLKDASISPEQLAALWMDNSRKDEILSSIADMNVYTRIVEAAREASQYFEKEKLTPFFNKVSRAVREVDTGSMIFFETNYFCNMGIESGVEAITDTDGNKDSLQVFAPHGYDLVVDTDNYDVYNNARVELIFDTHRKVQERLQIPVMFGEWGGFSDINEACRLSRQIIKIFEEYLWSNTYWAFQENIEKQAYMGGLIRAYPQSISGTLLSYSYDYDTLSFECKFRDMPGSTHPTVIYHPEAAKINLDKIHMLPEKTDCEIVIINGCNAGYVIVKPSGKDVVRKVTIST